MKNFLRLIVVFLLVGSLQPVLAQCVNCTFNATVSNANFNLNGNDTLCITANVSNLNINFNGSGNKICVASGITWTQSSGFNAANASIDVYGDFIMNGSYNFNSPVIINVKPGATLTTNSSGFGNNLTINNEGTVNFTNTSNITFNGTFVFNNLLGGSLNALSTPKFFLGNGSTLHNDGSVHLANYENEEGWVTNNQGGVFIVDRSFNNHGAFINNGDFQLPCNTLSGAAGATTCSFRIGDKGAGKEFISNTCIKVLFANLVFDGAAVLNAGVEVASGYDVTINKTVSGTNGSILVKGGVSTISSSGSFIGTGMKFYDANTNGNGFDNNFGNNPSNFTVSADAGCSKNCSLSITDFVPSACYLDSTGKANVDLTVYLKWDNPTSDSIKVTFGTKTVFVKGIFANPLVKEDSIKIYNITVPIASVIAAQFTGNTQCSAVSDSVSLINNCATQNVGSIGNYVWFDTNNSGTQDVNDTPIVGALVSLTNSVGNVLKSTHTDSNGKYLFDNLASGTYRVKFFINPDSVFIAPKQSIDSTIDSNPTVSTGLSGIITIDVTKPINDVRRNNLTVDAGVTIALGSIGGKTFNDLNKNNVQDSTDTNRAGVWVYLYKQFGVLVKIDSVLTDAQGGYLFNQLVSGNYTLVFATVNGYNFDSPHQGNNTTKDSDVINSQGITDVIVIDAMLDVANNGRNSRYNDAGYVVKPPDCSITICPPYVIKYLPK